MSAIKKTKRIRPRNFKDLPRRNYEYVRSIVRLARLKPETSVLLSSIYGIDDNDRFPLDMLVGGNANDNVDLKWKVLKHNI